MKKLVSRSVFLLLVLIVFVLQFEQKVLESVAAPSLVDTPHGFYKVVSAINQTAYEKDVKTLSNLSRFSGYPGFFEASRYIASKFSEAGLYPYGNNKDYFMWFNVTVPLDEGAWIITSDGLNVTAFPMYPNLVVPNQYNSEDWDTLVYVGDGNLRCFDGLNVTNKFVLMDFASGWNYYNAIALKAKGVIFIPDSTDALIRPEADQKIALLPVYFPKLYLPYDEKSRALLDLVRKAGIKGIRIKVFSSQTWKEVAVPNVIGYLPGSDPILSKKIVVISAYYDSFSVVPSLSFGATDALGIAELLQLVQFLAKNPPKYSVLFVALAAHYQGLWGAREFVERYFNDLEDKIVVFVSMDLASESDQIGVYAQGSTYLYKTPIVLSQRYTWLVSKLFGPWLSEMKMVLGSTYGDNFVDGILLSHPFNIGSVKPYEPYLYGYFSSSSVFPSHVSYLQQSYMLFDSDPFVLAMYGGGFTFHTTNDFRTFQRTPNDVYKNINFTNIWPQLQFIHCSLWALLNEEIKLLTSKSRFSDDWGYVTLNVTVTTYDFLTSYYDKINFTKYPELRNNLLVYFVSGGLRIIQKVSESSSVIIHGLKPYIGGSVDVFAIDKEGRIIWTTDTGVWSAPGGKFVSLSSNPNTKIISIFKCASIIALFMFQPTDFSSFRVSVINDARAHSPMIQQNIFSADIFYAMFVQPNTPSELIFSIGAGLPSGLLNNASNSNPIGSGYSLKEGEQLILTPVDVVRELYFVTYSRYRSLKEKLVVMPVTEYYSKLTKINMDLLNEYLERDQYSKAYGSSILLWAAVVQMYNSVMNVLGQIVPSLATFFIISLLFSFLVVKFFSTGKNMKLTFSSFIVTLLFSNILMYIFHPAPSLVTNWIIILLSTLFISLVFVLLVIVVAETYSSMKLAQEKSLGKHFIEISRSGLLVESVNMALENLKKRRLRTIIALTSITVVVFSMMVLASVTFSPVLLPQKVNGTSSYIGAEIRVFPWSPINALVYRSIENLFENYCYIAPRAFLYPPPLAVSGPSITAQGLPYIAFSSSMKTQIYAILALTPQEDNVTGISKLLIKGKWFSSDDVFSVVLPESVASSLSNELNRKVDINSTIILWGLNLKVVGIISDKIANFTNPDGESITPLDPTSIITSPSHITGKNLIVIPFTLYEQIVYPPTIANVAIRPKNVEYFNMLKELPFELTYPLYYSYNLNYSEVVTGRQWVSVEGLQYFIIPAIITSMTIFDTMLASVYERKREINIFSAVGMAPSHILMSFITEALAYIIPSVFIGYILGLFSTYLLIMLKLFPSNLYPNFSSLAILFVVIIDFIVILLSSIYPSNLAGRLAVPSLAKKWTHISKGPEGDVWNLAFPLILTSKEEVHGFMHYVDEYMRTAKEREGLFYVEQANITETSTSDEEYSVVYSALCRFAPFDLGIKSNVVIKATKQKGVSRYLFSLTVSRIEGYRQSWRTTATAVVDELRKQLITWRTLSTEERSRYITKSIDKKRGES